ncbi:MAG: efflux RND transporter permease subunit [Porphyromonas sp.]|nr:efflux RND transporter permease subunit [Porphyromonas sp.]
MRLDRFIKRPILSTVISIFVVILGVIGIFALPIERYPDIAPPTIQVHANYPGANAETVINSVLAPLEEAINGVEKMTHMTSRATNAGSASITVYFESDVDPDMAQVNVQNRVTRAQALLPAEVTRAGVSVIKRQASTLTMVVLEDKEDRYDPLFLQNYADINVLPQIMRISGVGEASVPGAKNYTMRIWLKPEVMAQYHLMPQDVVMALNEQNIEAAPGELGQQGDQAYQYTLTTRGRLKNAEEFGEVILRADASGKVLRLKDVADVELGALFYSVSNTVNGKNAVGISVNQAAGSNATQVVQDIQKLMADMEDELPPGITVSYGLNVNDFLYAAMGNVLRTLIEAFILVMLVVYIFLQDFRSTLIPAIAIPVSLVGTFFFLQLFGFSINLLVLSALVLAIAIVVDDAIVVVEAVHAKLDRGYTSSRQASIDAMSEISGAIVSITLVMMAVFIPVSFIGGVSGVFYQQFGITMAIAIGLSAINALTLSPALCAVFLKGSADPETGKRPAFIERFHIAFNTSYDRMLAKYRSAIERLTHKKGLTLGVTAIAIAITGFLIYKTPTGFVPTEDNGALMVQVSLQPGAALEETSKAIYQVSDIIRSQPEVEKVIEFSGFGLMSGIGSSYGTLFVQLKPWSERKGDSSTSEAVQQRLMGLFRGVPNANVIAFVPPTIPGYSATGGVSLSLQDKTGGDLMEFFQIAQEYIGALNRRPEIAAAFTTFNPAFPMYEIEVDAAKLKMAGISPQTIYSTLQGYVGGMYVSNFNSFGRLYRVYMQAAPDARANLEDLNSIYVRNGNQMAPITQFVSIKEKLGPQVIDRFNLFNSISVNATPAPGYSSGEAIAAVQEVANLTLPSGYSYEFSGLTREEQQSGGSSSTVMVLLLSLIFIYLLLSAQYESYLLPLAVIVSVIFGLMGTFLFAQIFGVENNIYVQIAMIMLIGLLAKNAILIIEYGRQRRERGMSISRAAEGAAAARLRPIIMTSLALIIGLLPLLFSTGAGASGNYSLGVAAIGGMLIGVIIQVFFVPGLFYIFQNLQEKVNPIVVEEPNKEEQ